MRKLSEKFKLISWAMYFPEEHWKKIGIYCAETDGMNKTDFIRQAIYAMATKKGLFTKDEVKEALNEIMAGRRR